MKPLKTFEALNEDISGGEVFSSSADIYNSTPSNLPGNTVDPMYSANNGVDGSGDVSVPYNSGSTKSNTFQKLSMGKNHGAHTGKKSREKKIDIKALKNMFAKKQDSTKTANMDKKPRVMNFDDFAKADINQIKR